VSNTSNSIEIERLHKLHIEGALTAEEFQKAKENILKSNEVDVSFGFLAKRMLNFIIGVAIFIVVATILGYFFVIVPSNEKMDAEFKAHQEKNEKEFKEFENETDRKMEEFRKKHGFK
jgi:uncharacterized protein YqhQ